MYIKILNIFDKAKNFVVQDILDVVAETPIVEDEENMQPYKVRRIYSFHQAGFSLSVNEEEQLCKAIFYVQEDEKFKKYMEYPDFFNSIDALNEAEKTLGKPARQLSSNSFVFYYFQAVNYWQVLKFSKNHDLLSLSILSNSAIPKQFSTGEQIIRTCKG